MSWDFLTLYRRTYKGDDNWGELFVRNRLGKLERFSYTYELPWKTFQKGALQGKSKNNKSRIRIGTYELESRSDGPKGWRMELQDTEHRSNIQIHRAHSSMYIEGCILPLTFNDISGEQLKKGNQNIQTQSVALMAQLKARYDQQKLGKTGNPEILIAAILPAVQTNKYEMYV